MHKKYFACINSAPLTQGASAMVDWRIAKACYAPAKPELSSQQKATPFGIRCVPIRMFFEALPSRAENDVFHCVECDVLISVMFASGE